MQVLRHFPQPGQRSAASSFPERDLVSVESPAILSTAGADTYFLDGFAVETQDPKVQGSTKRRSATKRSCKFGTEKNTKQRSPETGLTI